MTCPCQCHGQGALDATCDIPGGCGSGGCDYLGTEARNDGTGHRCVRGDRCKAKTVVRDEKGAATGYFLPGLITAARGLCERCTSDVTHALNHLTGDVVELTMLVGRFGSGGDIIVTATPELKIPIQVHLEALRAEIDSELQAWAEPVAEALGIEWDTASMSRTRMAPRVQRAAHLLTRAVDTFLALPEVEHPAWENGEPVWDHELGCQDTTVRDGIDGGLHFIELHRRAYAALGRSNPVYRLPTPCPWCDYKSLVRENGGSDVHCEHCHKIIPERHYSWFVSVLVDERQRAQREGAQREGAQREEAVA